MNNILYRQIFGSEIPKCINYYYWMYSITINNFNSFSVIDNPKSKKTCICLTMEVESGCTEEKC